MSVYLSWVANLAASGWSIGHTTEGRVVAVSHASATCAEQERRPPYLPAPDALPGAVPDVGPVYVCPCGAWVRQEDVDRAAHELWNSRRHPSLRVAYAPDQGADLEFRRPGQ